MVSICRDSGLAATVSWLVLLAGPASAGEIEVLSRIDRVTVFPDAATIQRNSRVDLPAGTSVIVYRDLPMGLDPASLRVEGSSTAHLSIGAVETRIVPASVKAPDGSLEARLKQLRGDHDGWQTTLEALEAKKAMILRFAQSGPEKLSPESRPLDIAQWGNAWDTVGQGLAKIGDELLAARGRVRDIDDEIKSIEQARQRPAPVSTRRAVTVEIESDVATSADLLLSYRVSGAGWQPVYDAQLDTTGTKPSLELVRRATVTQRTGEDWRGVQLSVSTVRVGRGTQAPDLQTQRVAFYDPRPIAPALAPAPVARSMAGAPDVRADKMEVLAAVGDGERAQFSERAREVEASTESGNWQASFLVPGKVDVPSDGATKNFRIASSRLAPDLVVRAKPALDETAYLEARIVNADDAPLLPGAVNLRRDGMYVGMGRIALVAPGDSANLGFGADDRVKVARSPVRIKESDPSWMGSSRTEQREFKTVVHNLHPFLVKVSIVDRIPVSENSAIVVEAAPAMTPPTDKIVNDRRGVMGWTYDMAPDASKEIHLAYRMKWPADREVVFQALPGSPGSVR